MLDPTNVILAYCSGAFPMAAPEEDDQIYWYAPDPRAILPLDDFHVSKSLARTARQGRFEVVIDRDFEAVMRACAAPREEADSTWISEEMVQTYVAIHEMGLAHSVECWREERLVGGLYGVALGGAFMGESMFHVERDASKVALVYLVERLQQRDYELLDIQFMTPHLARFGAVEIPREEYERRLLSALEVPARFA